MTPTQSARLHAIEAFGGPFAALWSGGKDCALAVALAREQGVEVAAFVSVVDERTDRVRFHATRASVLEAQASSAGVELRLLRTGWAGMDAALSAELAGLRAAGFAGVVMGNIHLADVRAWYEERTAAAGLRHLEPVWGTSPELVVEEYRARGGRALITCVELASLGAEWLGRELGEAMPPQIDAAGERGEYHTLAVAGPPFGREIDVVARGRLEIEPGYAQLDLANIGST